MKKISSIFLLLFCLNAHAIEVERIQKVQTIQDQSQRDYEMTKELMKQELYFAAIPYAAEYVIKEKNWGPHFEKMLETLILKTGPNSLTGIDAKTLSSHKSPSLAFILGLKLFKDESFKNTVRILNQVPSGHRFAPESLIIQASALNLLGKNQQSLKKYSQCSELAKNLEDKSAHEKLKRYYAIIKEQCQIHVARNYYKEKNYKLALKEYDKISKNSYLWPYILLEKAWAHYYLEDPNRSLGLLVTYRSPLLSSYFLPESEVLSALSYHKLCLWDDTAEVIDQYYDVYKSRSDDLKSILLKHKNSDTYFLRMMLSPIEKVEKMNPFIRNLLTQVRKRVKFSVDLVNYNNAQEEFKLWRDLPSHNNLTKKMTKQVHYQMAWRTKQLNHYIKAQMFSFINDIHRFSYEMFNIRLEVLSNKRDQIYTQKAGAQEEEKRERGQLKNVNRKPTEQFYEFTGEFWADELGDYSFGLPSQCEEQNRSFSYISRRK